MTRYHRSFIDALVGDGGPLLLLTGLVLCLSGGFALFLSATGHFLPHDIQYLGMTAERLCGLDQSKIVHFMFHDRVAFGGSLIAIGSLYMWLAKFPLQEGEAWAWWLFVVSSVTGFGSFLAYLGYGYLDTWHGAATLFLLPCVVLGLYGTFGSLRGRRDWRTLLVPAVRARWTNGYGLGRLCLLGVATGMIAGGLTIMMVGMTHVFVPQDLAFLQMRVADLNAVNPRLVPLIAHDRAGFGGGVCTCGILIGFLAWCGKPCRSLWQALLLAGTAGFGTAIGIHPIIGYLDFVHLAPALFGMALFAIGMVMLKEPMYKPQTFDLDAKRTTQPAPAQVV